MTVVGVAWFKKEEWAELQRIATDADQLGVTWETWATNAEKTVADLMRKGLHIEKVEVDVSDLALWCRAMGRDCDGAARAAYAAVKLKER